MNKSTYPILTTYPSKSHSQSHIVYMESACRGGSTGEFRHVGRFNVRRIASAPVTTTKRHIAIQCRQKKQKRGQMNEEFREVVFWSVRVSDRQWYGSGYRIRIIELTLQRTLLSPSVVPPLPTGIRPADGGPRRADVKGLVPSGGRTHDSIEAKKLVKNTWKSVLKDEDKLPKDWTWETEVLCRNDAAAWRESRNAAGSTTTFHKKKETASGVPPDPPRF
ncbi:hypothetical protein C8R43DRAFT_949220 [Mycena crocata]|nr:hypothetical protein C8R43DRAFT_949220 [Mycena crocata]